MPRSQRPRGVVTLVRVHDDSELDEELAFHLEAEARERGNAAARRDLGSIAFIKEETRAAVLEAANKLAAQLREKSYAGAPIEVQPQKVSDDSAWE